MNLPNAIIGGISKAGTTAVFEYLSAHPEVCVSSVKETYFFLREYTGDPQNDITIYGKYFLHCKESSKIILEASPVYLMGGRVGARVVANRIDQLLNQPKILFILRNPVDRIYSAYNFQMQRLNLPKTLTFEDYIDLCLQKEAAENPLDIEFDVVRLNALKLNPLKLNFLKHGCYTYYLKDYLEVIPSSRIWVGFYENLRSDPQTFMKSICSFLEIDPDFYEHYEFRKVNVTYSSKYAWLHRVAVMIRRSLDSFLRKRPKLRRQLLEIHKKINLREYGYMAMSNVVRDRLKQYYKEPNKDLEKLLGRKLPPEWY